MTVASNTINNQQGAPNPHENQRKKQTKNPEKSNTTKPTKTWEKVHKENKHKLKPGVGGRSEPNY